MHRLRAAGAEIDDGEPALAQRDAACGFGPDITAIGTAMTQRLVHGAPIASNASSDVAARQSTMPAIPHMQ